MDSPFPHFTLQELDALAQLCDRVPLIGPQSKAVIASAQDKLIQLARVTPQEPSPPSPLPLFDQGEGSPVPDQAAQPPTE